jgi:hypothetical protein
MRRFILALCIFLLIFGCANIRKELVKLSEEDMANAETSRIIAKNILSTWPINSGFIRGSLGPRINELPVNAIKALDELDALAKKTEWSDFELGYSLGIRVQLLTEVVAAALKLYAPQILQYVPMTF